MEVILVTDLPEVIKCLASDEIVALFLFDSTLIYFYSKVAGIYMYGMCVCVRVWRGMACRVCVCNANDVCTFKAFKITHLVNCKSVLSMDCS